MLRFAMRPGLSSSRSASPPPNPTTEFCNRIESRYAKIQRITPDGQTAVQCSEELCLFALLSGLIPSTFVKPSPPSPTLHSQRLLRPVFGSTRVSRFTWQKPILLMQQVPSSAGNATPRSTSLVTAPMLGRQGSYFQA